MESAWKLARQYHRMHGQAQRTKIIAREVAYHGTTFGALSITGITPLRTPFEPLVPGAYHAPNTNSYRWPEERDPLWAADQLEHMIEFQDPETVAAVILEPVQNSGGCFVPQDGYWQRVREICDRHGVLLISDEVICSWGRLGHYFGCERFGVEPDMITTAKGITSAYAPMGAVITADKVAEPFMEGKKMFTHGITFGGHPVSGAVALANLDIFEREDLCGHVLAKEGEFGQMLEGLKEDLPIVGDVRGAGYFHALELVKDKETKESFERRRVRGAAPGLHVGRALPAGADLPRGRPRRPRDPALAAADRRQRAVPGDRHHAARGAHRGLGPDRPALRGPGPATGSC